MSSPRPSPDAPGQALSWREVRERHVVFEDEAVLALNKPAGVSVMGERHAATDLVRIAAEEGGERLFPVHRIDKVTSGLVLLAKELRHHGGLTRQFSRQTVDKVYLAVTRRQPGARELPGRGTIDLPLTVGRKNRVRIAGNREDITREPAGEGATWRLPPDAVFADRRTYPSLTHLVRVWQAEDGDRALLALRPVTGRRHQIRVHLAWIGHPIEGDPLFERTTRDAASLHSWRLSFDADWAGGARMCLTAPPNAAFWPDVAPGPSHTLPDRVEDALAALR
ncbi:RluA family pseudouridine synthase [Streptomyces sp. 4N509B]|uniref:RluA family pseudouridine synthase n=1 Tax=Streptomyces sp. 4N509B TaxID=3457413 RepID=UPI003FD5614C